MHFHVSADNTLNEILLLYEKLTHMARNLHELSLFCHNRPSLQSCW